MPSGNPNMGANKTTGTAGKPGSNSGKDAGSKSGAGGPGGANRQSSSAAGGNSGPKSSGGASKSTGPAANRQSASAASGKSTSNSGGRGPAASMAAGANSNRDQSGTGLGGMLSGSRGPSPASRQGAAQAASANRSGGVLSSSGGPSAASRAGHAQAMTGSLSQGLPGRGGMVPTPETHPFRDPSRFNYPASYVGGPLSRMPTELHRQAVASGLNPYDQIAAGLVNGKMHQTPLSELSMLANLQSAYGKPLGITSGYSPAHSKGSIHHSAQAFDLDVPGGIAEKSKVASLAAQTGFGGIGASYNTFPGMVHVDTGPTRQWGPNNSYSSAPQWQRDAVAAGRSAGPLNMASIAAQTHSPTFGTPSLRSAVVGASGTGLPSNFPGRPGLPGAMGFPAEDRQPSTFPGRPEASQQFNSQIAGRPAPQPQFNSMMTARPEKTGLGFPAAFRSDFPDRPAPQAGFASQIAGRPDPQQGFMSQMAGKPDFPGALPGAQVTDNFPGRPQMPQGFQSQMAGRPGLPQSFNSQIASRVGVPGSGFPAAKSYQNPGRSFANIPSSGIPQQQVAQAGEPMDLRPPGEPLDIRPPDRYGFSVPGQKKGAVKGTVGWAGKQALVGALGMATGVPGLGLVEQGFEKLTDLKNAGKLGNRPGQPAWNGMDHGYTYDGGSDAQGGPAGNGQGGQWTGTEPPPLVSAMQQHVEQVLASYFATPQTQFPGYSSDQWANLPAGSAA